MTDLFRSAVTRFQSTVPIATCSGTFSAMSHMYDFSMTSITGESVDLGSYKGTVCLIVNVASA